ncbi:hypothetical protein E9228_000910 [Curtobacterium flaccumfaciens]|uniref:Lipoprotein n=1 Tax=Curtobacterium salicis TaxID=1779862 RepID=A0ABX0T5B0_9MICO|nr:hypothetical protein [Curtobacterium sp. WW7]NII40274.1 hypothetical protein [Curtobacterium sp. WW7]
MRSRPARSLLALAMTGLVLGVAACSSAPPAPRPTLARAASDAVTVVAQESAAERSVRASRALFRSAPGAVVAPTGDADAVRTAASAAVRAHVPALLVDSGSTASTDAVADELERLGASWYRAVGDVTLDTRVPERDAPEAGQRAEAGRASRQTVLVADRSEDAAAVATARAAGAQLVEMPSGVSDPAASGSVVRAMHDAAGHPTLLLGASFAGLQDPEWVVRAAQTGYRIGAGGQRPFDGHRYTALYGAPGAPVLGVLGEQDPAASVTRARKLAAEYRGLSDVPVTPAFEVIATVAAGEAGDDGDYSRELPVSTLEPYVDAAHEAGMPTIIDLQPGRSDFLTQAERYESLLSRPDVWLALDPEWRLGPDQVPLKQIGTVSAAEVNGVSKWLAGLVRREGLPPKAFVLHQFRSSMVSDRGSLASHPELDLLVHVDGQGSQPDKQATWKALHDGGPDGLHWGWKNFFDEDTPMLTPEQTMSEVQPTPSLVTYQ